MFDGSKCKLGWMPREGVQEPRREKGLFWAEKEMPQYNIVVLDFGHRCVPSDSLSQSNKEADKRVVCKANLVVSSLAESLVQSQEPKYGDVYWVTTASKLPIRRCGCGDIR